MIRIPLDRSRIYFQMLPAKIDRLQVCSAVKSCAIHARDLSTYLPNR